MKVRESGMPDECTWEGFFQPDEVLAKLALTDECENVLDFGCGYGTFTIPAARIAAGTVYALDLDPHMIETTCAKAKKLGLSNICAAQRDFLAEGSGLPGESIDYVMLFNILHAEERGELLREAHRALKPGGLLGIMHWNCDPNTPRGPSMSIRPTPHELRHAAERAGFTPTCETEVGLPPYHYGWVMQRPRR